MIDQGAAILSLMQSNLYIFLSPESDADLPSLTLTFVLEIHYNTQNMFLFTLTPAGLFAVPSLNQLQFSRYLEHGSGLSIFIFLAINFESSKIA